MAKIMQDGFEYMPSTVGTALTTIGGYAQGSGISRQTGRFGGSTLALRIGGSGVNPDGSTSPPVYLFGATYSRIIGGLTFRSAGTPSSPSITGRIISFLDATTGNMNTTARIQVGIGLDLTTFAVVVYRGTTEIGRSASGLFASDTWYRLEWDITFNDTTGSVTLKLAGSTILTLTSQDTNNALSSVINGFRLNYIAQGNGGLNMDFDDVVMMDSTGSAPLNGFIGDCRIDRLAPTADVAAVFSRTGTGSGNWDVVDEQGVDATNYVEGTTGQTDVYELADLASATEIIGLTLRARMFRTGTTLFNMTFGLQAGSGAAVSNFAVQAGQAAAATYALHMDLNPDTATAWTPTEIDALRLHATVGV